MKLKAVSVSKDVNRDISICVTCDIHFEAMEPFFFFSSHYHISTMLRNVMTFLVANSIENGWLDVFI